MNSPTAQPTATRLRWLKALLAFALLAALFAVGVWSFIEWRSAAPPPPKVEMPGMPPR